MDRHNFKYIGLLNVAVFSFTLFANASSNGGFSRSKGMKPEKAALMNTTIPDVDPPSINFLLPSQNASGVSTANPIIVSADEPLVKGTGNITITDVTDGSSSEVISISSPSVQILGNAIKIRPSAFLDENTLYSIAFDTEAIKDCGGNDLPTAPLSFTTGVLNRWNGVSWSKGSPPSGGQSVAIAANQSLMISENLTFLGLDLKSGASIEVMDGFKLKVEQTAFIEGDFDGKPGSTVEFEGDVFNNGTVTIESGSSILTYGNKTYSGNDLNLVKNTTFGTSVGKYSVVGSPITEGFASSLGSLLYSYDETKDFTINQGAQRFIPVSSGTALTPGQGYFSAFTGEVTFSGVPNSGTIEVATTFTDRSNANDGFNLVSNPYGAAINFASFMTENGSSGLDILEEETIWIWEDGGSDVSRGTDADYIVINSMGSIGGSGATSKSWNNHISSMQGFFVKVDQSTNVRFTESMRVDGNNDDGGFFRKDEIKKFKLTLHSENVSENGLKSQTLVGFSEDASVGIDRKYDASSISTNPRIQLFTRVEDKKLSIQGLPVDLENHSIDLRYDLSQEGLYTLSMSEATSLTDDKVLIVDNVLNSKFELSPENSFTFRASAGENQNRYSLLINPSNVLDIENELESMDMIVFKNLDNNLQINFKGESIGSASIEIHSISGKTVMYSQTYDLHNNTLLIEKNLDKGIYIVSARASNGVSFVKKVYLLEK